MQLGLKTAIITTSTEDDMTEDQIERLAERKMDILDEKFLNGILSEQEYERAIDQLNSYISSLYKKETA